MKVYFISGLGADERAFSKIVLPPSFEAVFVKWIVPEKWESLQHYAIRLCGQIDTKTPFALIGLSFGGMLASEIARVHQPVKLVLISSVSENTALPVLYKTAAKLRLDKLIPFSAMQKFRWMLEWLFGPLDKDSSSLLRRIIEQTDLHFLRWAVGAVLSWKTTSFGKPCLKVHGALDKILPLPDNGEIIQGAGHLAVYTHADDINQLLRNYLLS